ncbi:PD-(D/E)XK nuclease family protein [Candidatus Uhrbacteria bacterium]|nr:PD-(D/E)XK nuclease family protein [Candidatus Uhrbacteria bacterium]
MPQTTPRSASWNYGGDRWKLSRSKIENFLECPRCFYLNNVLGIKRPSCPPFNLNKAVDMLLKQEFDVHRAKGEQHPLQKKYGLDARPVPHEMIDEWRENFKGVQYTHPKTGLLVSGAIDDLWQDGTGNYIVVDYKATAKSEPVTVLNDDWHIGYKRQIEVYQWLLRRNGLKVSNTGYFVYCTGRPDEKAFDGKLVFDVHLISYEGNDDWIEPTLLKIKRTLNAKKMPKAGEGCEYCGYREMAKGVEG